MCQEEEEEEEEEDLCSGAERTCGAFRTLMALSGRFPMALSGRCGALRTKEAFSGHYANFGA